MMRGSYSSSSGEYKHGVVTIKGVARKFNVHRLMVMEAVENAVPKERTLSAFSVLNSDTNPIL
jgi:hypothetical protein